MDIKNWKLLAYHKIFYKILYKQQCYARLYLPRSEGLIVLINLKNVYRETKINVTMYIKSFNKKNI